MKCSNFLSARVAMLSYLGKPLTIDRLNNLQHQTNLLLLNARFSVIIEAYLFERVSKSQLLMAIIAKTVSKNRTFIDTLNNRSRY